MLDYEALLDRAGVEPHKRDQARDFLRDIVEVSGPSLCRAADQSRKAQTDKELENVEKEAERLVFWLNALSPHATHNLYLGAFGGVSRYADAEAPSTPDALRQQLKNDLAALQASASAGREEAKRKASRPNDSGRDNLLDTLSWWFRTFATQPVSTHDNGAYVGIAHEVFEAIGLPTNGLQDRIKRRKRQGAKAG